MSRSPLTRRLLRVVVPFGLALAAFALASTTRSLEAFSSSPYPLSKTPSFRPELTLRSVPPGEAPVGDRVHRVPVVRFLERGQTLETLLTDWELDRVEAHAVIAAFREEADLRRLRPGTRVAAYLDPAGSPGAFELEVDDRGRAVVTRDGDEDATWTSRFVPFLEERKPRTVRGTLDGSLIAAVTEGGAPEALAYRMADVLQWDLDFNRDLRQGDRFEVLYEEVFRDGRPAGPGDVLALVYENRGDRLEAYRFGDEPVYYDAEGRPLRKMFLRSPLPFSRVTSRFSHKRFHPVLKTYRPHYGVDYGAPTGTPIRVTARGTVVSAGWDRGGGRTVKVRHANGYLTAYLHLSKFAGGVRSGARVAQGQVIGYVGATGLATGPHLDYRVRHNGRWIDPLGMENVEAEPLAEEELPTFVAWRDVLQESLRTGESPGPAPWREPAEALRLAEAGDGPEGEGSPGSAVRAGR